MKPSPDIERLFGKAGQRAAAMRHDILTPEHFLRTLIDDPQFREAVLFVDIDLDAISRYLDDISLPHSTPSTTFRPMSPSRVSRTTTKTAASTSPTC